MDESRHVSIYLRPQFLAQVKAGKNAFIAAIQSVLEEDGFTTSLHEENEAGLLRQAQHPGYSLVERQHPLNERTLCLRAAYFRPFWHIEKSPAPWEWPVAQAQYFDREPAFPSERTFFNHWRRRLFPEAKQTKREGFIFVPLQGRPLVQRSFQSMSPIAMIDCLADRFPKRKIVITLHPGESYDDGERAAIAALCQKFDHVELGETDSATYLKSCDLVATQNSSIAFHGFFYEKPALFFAKTDCHHAVASVPRQGLDEAIATANLQMQVPPNFACYLHWFWQVQSINAGRPDASKKIRQALHDAGWSIELATPA